MPAVLLTIAFVSSLQMLLYFRKQIISYYYENCFHQKASWGTSGVIKLHFENCSTRENVNSGDLSGNILKMNAQIRNFSNRNYSKNQTENYGTEKYNSELLKSHRMGLTADWKGKKKKSVIGN